jgi:hypothetical protein
MPVSLAKPAPHIKAPDLEPHCGSWIIADNGEAILETWDREFADLIASRAMPGVVVHTAAQWLASLNTKGA